MNQFDLDYHALLRDILENGAKKKTRSGPTFSVFGRSIRHNLYDGFPITTTRKAYFKTMVLELLWFLRGETNIKSLVDNGCNIWVGDAYRNYKEHVSFSSNPYDRNIISSKPNEDWKRVSEFEIGEPFSQEEFLEKLKTDDSFAEKWGDMGKIYGYQWRRWGEVDNGWESIVGEVEPEDEVRSFAYKGRMVRRKKKGVDQIETLIQLLKTDPDSRRLIVNVWNPAEIKSAVLPPCHYAFQCFTRELSLEERGEIDARRENVRNTYGQAISTFGDEVGKWLDEKNIPRRAISLLYTMRSCDAPLGLVTNMQSYSLLLMLIAKQVNMVPEEVICNLADVHIYRNQVEGVVEQLKRTPYGLPTVRISDREVSDLAEYTLDDFTLENYVSHPKIFFPLSN